MPLSKGEKVKPGVPSISAAGWMLNQTLNQGTVPLRQMKTHEGGGAWPNYPGAGKVLGPAFVRIRSWWFWFAVLAAPAPLPYLPAATQGRFGSGEHPSHPHTHRLCLSKPSVDSYHFQTPLQAFFLLPFKFRLFCG